MQLQAYDWPPWPLECVAELMVKLLALHPDDNNNSWGLSTWRTFKTSFLAMGYQKMVARMAAFDPSSTTSSPYDVERMTILVR